VLVNRPFAFLAATLVAGALLAAGDDARRQIASTLFLPDPLPALSIETYGQFHPMEGVIAERASYATDYGLRIPAIVYRPESSSGKAPGIVIVNGHGGDKYSWYAFYSGLLYARAGAVVVTYDPIGEGERNAQRKSGTRQHDKYVDPPEMARRMGGLMITDVMQGVSYLAQRSDVDAKRIAALGYSMGSFIVSLTCAVDTRIGACVEAGGGNLDGDGGYWDSSSKKMCQAIPYQSLRFLGDRGAQIYNLHAQRGPTLIINGTADDVVNMAGTDPKKFFADLRERTIALHGGATNVFDFLFVEGGGHRPYWLTRAASAWLGRKLHFPHPVDDLPETHILEWAGANHVEMDKQYATELREGGTMALGSGFPGIPHAALNSLPVEKWERDKEKYVYESWVKNAKARVQ
jgi:dienelactone hydrolase